MRPKNKVNSRRVVILASQSPARRRLLKRLGLRFRVRPAHINEAAFKKRISQPKRLALELARAKALAVWNEENSALVIGSDQILVLRGKIFGKPGTEKKAVAQLMKFSGRTIDLLTAVCVVSASGEDVSFCHRTRMKFRKLTREEILAYVRVDKPLECAGSFMFERQGVSLFESVETDDPTAIEGLPLLHLQRIFRAELNT